MTIRHSTLRNCGRVVAFFCLLAALCILVVRLDLTGAFHWFAAGAIILAFTD